jgi:predicted dehydrogenase
MQYQTGNIYGYICIRFMAKNITISPDCIIFKLSNQSFNPKAYIRLDISRRMFIHRTSAMVAGTCLVPSGFISSCSPSGKAGHVRMGFVGPEEHFRYYRPMFKKLKYANVEISSLEEALNSSFHAIFIDSYSTIKASNIILLLEKNKDIITPYPLATSLEEYIRIQEYLDRFDRRLGMLNPLNFYPPVKTLKDWLADKNHPVSEIRVSCHPTQLVRGYHINGYAGTVQPLQRMISFITGKFPVSLFIGKNETNDLQRWMLDYESFQAIVQVDPGQTGWILEVEGPQLSALADHTGMLSLNSEVEPRLSPAKSVWNRSMVKNLEDFIQAVRLRKEPRVNSLDGLSAIILNQAGRQSMQSGTRVNL